MFHIIGGSDIRVFHRRSASFSSVYVVLLIVAGLALGSLAFSYTLLQQNNELRGEVSSLKVQLSDLKLQNATYQNITILLNGTDVSALYERVRDSVVLIEGLITGGVVEGSGFVYELNGSMYVVTNDHVVRDTTSIGVTFWNGNGYGATVVGADPYADLAVLSVEAPAQEFRPIEMSDSSTLRVGEMVAAVGNPYGLVDSITTGIVSALGRTLTEQYTGSYEIANVIQTSTPINPGNSGGPLLNYDGKVVGITTAAIQSSEGLGFAIPSNTIIRELPSLIGTGRYDDHPYLGGDGEDMSYLAGKELGVNVTYGWMLISVPSGVPLHGHLEAGDVIIGIDGATIKNGDELASYLEENSLPGETVTIRFVRGDRTLDVSVVLGRI